MIIDDCNDTLTLLNRPTFVCLLTFEMIIGFMGGLTNTFLLIALWKTRLFHNNLRILLIHMSFVALCYSLAVASKIVYVLIVRKSNPCRLVVTLYDCKLTELVAVIPLLTMMYSLVSIGVERMYATCAYRTYERSRNVGLSLVLLAVIWTFVVINQAAVVASISKIETTPFCVNLLVMKKWAALWMLVLGVVQEFVALALYLATYFINKTLYVNLLINRASDQTLTSRFQLAQNIQVSELMLPTAAAHAAFMLPTNGLAVLVVSGLDIDFIQRVELVHAAYLSALIYTFVHPIICFARNASLRRAVLGLLRCLKKREIDTDRRRRLSQKRRYTNDYELAGSANESDRHFDILRRTWQSAGK